MNGSERSSKRIEGNFVAARPLPIPNYSSLATYKFSLHENYHDRFRFFRFISRDRRVRVKKICEKFASLNLFIVCYGT